MQFELFRKSYRRNQAIEDNKALLKQKYECAKSMGKQLHEAKDKINDIKTRIQQIRIQRSVRNVVEPSDEFDNSIPDPEEVKARAMLEKVLIHIEWIAPVGVFSSADYY